MPTPSVLVVGDSLLDSDWDSCVDRISPKAPVPVLRIGGDGRRAGGAGNVAVSLATLCCAVTLATFRGLDETGDLLAAELHRHGINPQAVRDAGVTTRHKIRAVCRGQQLLRMDVERPPPEACVHALCELATRQLALHPWVLLSDYGKGSLAHCEALIHHATVQASRVLDPMGLDFSRYFGGWLLKPNGIEAAQVAGAWDGFVDFGARMGTLRELMALAHFLAAAGEQGMTLFSAGRTMLRLPARRARFTTSPAPATLCWPR